MQIDSPAEKIKTKRAIETIKGNRVYCHPFLTSVSLQKTLTTQIQTSRQLQHQSNKQARHARVIFRKFGRKSWHYNFNAIMKDKSTLVFIIFYNLIYHKNDVTE